MRRSGAVTAIDPSTGPRARAGHLGALAGIGLASGLMASLFGVGGGIVMVPLLIALLAYDARVATATSLAAIIFTAVAGAAAHGVLGNVHWGTAALVGLPAMVGVTLGVAVKERVSSAALTYGFASLMVGGRGADAPRVIAEAVLIVALGVAAGIAAGAFGVGGGIIFVPTLTLVLGLSQLDAEATSLLAIIPVAVLGSWRQTRSGTVRWRDATVIGLFSVVSAVAGALLAEVAPERMLRTGFAILLLITAARLVAGARRGAGAAAPTR